MSKRNTPKADNSWQVDVTVIGAGPAGCSAALWLSEMGFSVALVEKSSQLLARLTDLQLPQNWVLGAPGALTSDLAQQYAAHIRTQPGIRVALGDTITQAQRPESTADWLLITQTGQTIGSQTVVVATGLQPLTFKTCSGPEAPLDAPKLARQRASLSAGRTLLLGGGDNAVENAVYLTKAGHAVTLWARSPLRAQRHLLAQLERLSSDRLTLRISQPMPDALVSSLGKQGHTGAWQVSSAYGIESFDHVAVLFGNLPDQAVLDLFVKAVGSIDTLSDVGVFLAGDLSGRWYPCISTAIADGVEAAKKVQDWLNHETPHPIHSDVSINESACATGHRSLILRGLRVEAALGILDHERTVPQPIRVDAELDLGQQPLLPRDDDITHVLDYRKVRQLILDECTAHHVNLLESLTGRIAHRLLALSGVRGVRVQVAKTGIFPDCEVAICVEAGEWREQP